MVEVLFVLFVEGVVLRGLRSGWAVTSPRRTTTLRTSSPSAAAAVVDCCGPSCGAKVAMVVVLFGVGAGWPLSRCPRRRGCWRVGPVLHRVRQAPAAAAAAAAVATASFRELYVRLGVP